MEVENQQKKAWIIAADMGYGHQRTAYPLRGLSLDGKIINANNYEGIPQKDKNFWRETKTRSHSRIAGIFEMANEQERDC